MADERRLTRSKLKALNKDSDSSSSPPKKKPKLNKTDRALKDNRRSPNKDRTKKTSSLLAVQPSYQTEREIMNHETFNIGMREDEAVGTDWSMCMLDSGDLLIADSSNQVLKQINGDTYKIRNSLNLPTALNSVCKVSDTEAVVGLSNNSIQFVSTQDNLLPTRRLKFDHYCLGVWVMSDNIFITDGKNRNVFVYDMDGNILKKFGENIFSWNRFIVGSDDGYALYVTDCDRGLIKMDGNGEVIWKYRGGSLTSALGLCTDGLGNVFVAGYHAKNVVQIASDGEYLGEVVPSSICVLTTSAVCYDIQKSKLFVAGYGCDEISVYCFK